ncbi:MAG: hypothetical protein QFB87_02240 [Patescibacteria group bacterium]|nr:hypothetical protein [Patescibacteria group bacterium]
MAHESADQPQLVLPLLVVSPVDVGRLIRDVETLDNLLMQYDLKGATHEAKMPKVSLLLDSIIDANKLDLLVPAQRQRLLAFLQSVRTQAPVLHISFGADPAASFIEKLMTWLRREISPQVLLTIGLQPNIGAGCLVRSTNKFYDFSLRQNFTKNRELLMASFQEVAKT